MASLLAPCVASYYFNLGVAYDKGGRPRDAIRNFKLYLVAAPNADDARDVRKRIAGLEYTMEKAGRVKQEAREAERTSPKRGIGALAGNWYSLSSKGCPDWIRDRFDVRGGEIVALQVWDRTFSRDRTLSARTTRVRVGPFAWQTRERLSVRDAIRAGCATTKPPLTTISQG